MSYKAMIELFEQHRGEFVSGAMLSEALGVSRTAIWKQIRKLEAGGFEFEASTKRGYRLLFRPDLLDAVTVKAALGGGEAAGRDIAFYEEIDSTQNAARALAESGAAEGSLVIAERQVSGRGRMGRGWSSPAGKGIWMSMVLRPELPLHIAPQLTLLASVALCRSLKRTTGLPIGIKWPNDLLIDGKKISGILLESAAEDERLKYVVAGIGIGVNLASADYPEAMGDRATSLRIAAGRTFQRAELLADFIGEWDKLYALYLAEGFDPIGALWESLSISLGKKVRLVTPTGELEGTPVGLAESGAIRVELADGTQQTIFSAEMGEPLTERR